MNTRRDQVQAHGFLVGRLSTAMLEADPDAVEAPMNRTRTGAAIGLVLSLLIGAGFLVFGLIFPGNATSWRTEGTVVAVEDGGGRYVYSDGALWPVANQASALLLGEPVQVSAASLEGTPVASAIGIGGAPDAVPPPPAEDAGPSAWRVCAVPVATGEDEDPRALTALTVGGGEGDGETPVPADRAVLAAGPDGTRHLLWRGERLRLDAEHGALEALGYGTAPAHPVSARFLSALPEGPGLAAAQVDGAGGEGPRIGGRERRVGQVFTVGGGDGGSDQYYVLERDGLTPTGEVRARLLLADPRTAEEAYPGGDPDAVPLDAADVRPHLSDRDRDDAGLPGEPPALTETGGAALCAVDRGDGPTLALRGPSTITARAADPPPGAAASCTPPDLIGIPAGEGGLVRAAPAGGRADRGAYYLVTDAGAKYPVPDAESAERLGHPPGGAREVPAAVLDMLPTGPELSTSAAAGPAADPAPPEEADCPSG
ncbi:type VII secretion protein EccB [Nocardiopsis sp. RSe5-2]|uniref:Type VII secretion protein EccB n=1 Tax=Nocardiopsis endophytica TaxID=3018445 RepID=A0ABT4TWZ0_9ACTN|nr:type VII secretion protein EccB [Nocardiopsis endophytica]MDA2809218.1 type VII secretion protein EccB [Nocardiopsis endophytica]